MSMTTGFYLKLYLAAVVVFFAIDMVWLGVVARGLYRKYLGYLLSPSPNWTAAIIFYLLFVAGLLIFAVVPGLQAGSFNKALLLGALFGFMTYATYDLTNLATIKDWPLFITIVDMIWGVVLASAVTSLTFLIGRWMS
ncbi:MAG: DUF2177 family protein [Anaerolineales bacterium]|nr:DUF2177 family protein [Anaerolineales bacterium]